MKLLSWPRPKPGRFRTGAGGWRRDAGNIFAKHRLMNDGEVLALLADRGQQPPDEFDAALYETLQKLQEQLAKAFTASLAAAALGLLSYLGIVKSAGTAGLEFNERSFSVIAVGLLGVTSFWFATVYSKVTYLRAWFSQRFASGSPRARATLLLRYPEAYWFITFLPGARGYPAHVWPKRSQMTQLVPILLLLAALFAYGVGGLALYFALAREVWLSNYPSPFAAHMAVIGSVLLMLLSLTCPMFSEWKRSYVHYGMTDAFAKVTDRRRPEAQRRIAAATIRMGLVE